MAEKIQVLMIVRQAAAQALAVAVAGPCEACGARDARPYAFAYARVVGRAAHQTGTATVTTTTFESVSAQTVHLCPTCVLRRQNALVSQARRTTLIFGAVWLVITAVFAVTVRAFDLALVIGLTGVALTALVSLQIRRLSKEPRIAGQAQALALRQNDLKRQGFDAFWCDPTELDLQPQAVSN